MTRIVAGTAKGRTLQVPPKGTRPTSAKVREAIFSKLANWDAIADARVLDLYAGSGALGLEALSRGAAQLTSVDSSRAATKVIERNIAAVGSGPARVLCRKVPQYLATVPGPFDLVFADPPYAFGTDSWAELFAALPPVLSEGALVVAERSAAEPLPPLPEELELWEERSWGDTGVWFLAHAPQ